MNQMKLSDFISQALRELVDGVSDAQAYAEGKGALVNPPHVNWSDTKKAFYSNIDMDEDDENPLLTPIDFEVLLTIGSDDKAKGGIGLFAASLGIGIQGEATERQEYNNRIKFQILAKLPQQGQGAA